MESIHRLEREIRNVAGCPQVSPVLQSLEIALTKVDAFETSSPLKVCQTIFHVLYNIVNPVSRHTLTERPLIVGMNEAKPRVEEESNIPVWVRGDQDNLIVCFLIK